MLGQSREVFSLLCIGFEHTHHGEFCRVRAELVEAFLHVLHALFLTGRTTPIGMLHGPKNLKNMPQKLEPTRAVHRLAWCADGTERSERVALRKEVRVVTSSG